LIVLPIIIVDHIGRNINMKRYDRYRTVFCEAVFGAR